MRCGDGDAYASEAARADPNNNLIRSPAVEHFGDHRNEPFGMPTPDYFVAACDAAASDEQGGGAGGGRRVEREDHPGIVLTCGGKPQALGLNGFYGFYFGHVMPDQTFDAAFERNG